MGKGSQRRGKTLAWVSLVWKKYEKKAIQEIEA